MYEPDKQLLILHRPVLSDASIIFGDQGRAIDEATSNGHRYYKSVYLCSDLVNEPNLPQSSCSLHLIRSFVTSVDSQIPHH